jgi:hypothetical protein
MFLVPLDDTTRMYPDPTTYLVTTVIDELETLAVECREASADRWRDASERSLRSIRSLNQLADTCDEIIQILSSEYSSDITRRPTRSGRNLRPDGPFHE